MRDADLSSGGICNFLLIDPSVFVDRSRIGSLSFFRTINVRSGMQSAAAAAAAPDHHYQRCSDWVRNSEESFFPSCVAVIYGQEDLKNAQEGNLIKLWQHDCD